MLYETIYKSYIVSSMRHSIIVYFILLHGKTPTQRKVVGNINENIISGCSDLKKYCLKDSTTYSKTKYLQAI